MSLTPTRTDPALPVTPQLPVMRPDAGSQSEGDYADQIAAMTREEVLSRGMPREPIERCISDLFTCLFDGKEPKFADPSAYTLVTAGHSSNTYEMFGGMIRALKDLIWPQFWRPASNDDARQGQHVVILTYADNLRDLLEIPKNYPADLLVPTKRILLKCIDCLIHRIALDKNMQNQSCFSLPQHGMVKNQLFCLCTKEGWRCAGYDTSANHPIHIVQCNVTNTQNILLDENHKVINERGVIITAELFSELNMLNLSQEEQAIRNGHVVMVKFLFYDGASGAFGPGRNSLTISANIDLRSMAPRISGFKEESILILKPGMQNFITQKEKESYFQQARDLCVIFSDRVATRMQQPVMIPLFYPQSPMDCVQTVSKILGEIEKEPEKHFEELTWVAEQLNPTFSEKEVTEMVKIKDAKKNPDGTFEITPEALVKKLRKDVNAKRRPLIEASLKKLKAPAGTTPQSPLPLPKEEIKAPPVSQQQDALPAKADAECECVHAQLEKQAHKAIMRQQYEFDLLKQKKKAEASGFEEKKPQAFELTPREQATVDSIYNGNSVKVDDFVPVAMNLLKKKAESLGATTTSRRKGSHLKFHLKKASGMGSTGVTFVLQHKKRDHQGSLSAQKDVLERIFALE